MDMDMKDFLIAVAETITDPPPADAPADYLHQRSLICYDALTAVAEGEHPLDAQADMERREEEAARPAPSALMVWAPARTTA